MFWGIFSNNRLIRFLVGSYLQIVYYSDSIRGTAIVLICYNCKAFTKCQALLSKQVL